jgi:hypothetical protein
MAAWKEDVREVLKGIYIQRTLIVPAGLERLGASKVPGEVFFPGSKTPPPRRGLLGGTE